MDFAFVRLGAIQSPTPAFLPTSARLLDAQGNPTGGVVLGLREADVAHQEACGYFVITDTPKPADQAGKVWESSYAMVDGRPTQVWTQRDFTAEETANATRQTNRQTIESRASSALASNATFLGIASPTNAQVRDQVIALTKQMNGVIKLLLRDLDSVSGTA